MEMADDASGKLRKGGLTAKVSKSGLVFFPVLNHDQRSEEMAERLGNCVGRCGAWVIRRVATGEHEWGEGS